MEFGIEYIFDENGAIKQVALDYEDFKKLQELIMEAKMILEKNPVNKNLELEKLEINKIKENPIGISLHKLTIISEE